MLAPLAAALVYREESGIWFLIVGAASLAAGWLITRQRPASTVFYMREGCIATALSWMLISLVGALPLYFSGEIPGFTDALFEMVSGFTTTGATILPNVEALSRCMLLWRSLSQWLGGMGVLVLLLAVIQMAGGSSNMNLMRAESPGPSVGKLAPKVKETARLLYQFYAVMTIVLFLFLVAGRMPVFEAINTAMSTAGTGGFAIVNGTVHYSAYEQWMITVFMILFGVNFNVYYLIYMKKYSQLRHMEEMWVYFAMIALAVVVIYANICLRSGAAPGQLRNAAFHVASFVTTTGLLTAEFRTWSATAKCIFIFLMLIGACSGSTGGGMKVSRFILTIKSITRELNSFLYPRSIKRIKMGGRPIDEETVHGANIYFITYVVIIVLSSFLVSFEGKDLVATFTSVVSALNNVGIGTDIAGVGEGFGRLSALSKYVLMFDMLAGRLELFPLLILVYPQSWRGLMAHKKRIVR